MTGCTKFCFLADKLFSSHRNGGNFLKKSSFFPKKCSYRPKTISVGFRCRKFHRLAHIGNSRILISISRKYNNFFIIISLIVGRNISFERAKFHENMLRNTRKMAYYNNRRLEQMGFLACSHVWNFGKTYILFYSPSRWKIYAMKFCAEFSNTSNSYTTRMHP